MSAAKIIEGTVFEDSACFLMARIAINAGTDPADDGSDFTGISLSLYDIDGSTPGTAISGPTALTPDTVINARTDDERWTVDTTGYDFGYELDLQGIGVTEGNRLRAIVTFNPSEAGANDFVVVYDLNVIKVTPTNT